MSKGKRKKKYVFGIKQKTLSFIAFPCIMIALFATIYVIFSYRDIIRDDAREKLNAATYGAKLLSETNSGDQAVLAQNIESLSAQIGIEITIFKGNVREITTVDGALGTKMDSHIEEELVKTREDLFVTNANVNGQSFYGYYVPYFEDSKLSGAVFAGVPRADAVSTITDKTVKMAVCIIVITVLFLLLAAVQINGLLKKLYGSVDLVEQLHSNDLKVDYNERFRKNSDEYEEIYNSTYEFASNLNGIVANIQDTSENLHGISSELSGNAEIANATTSEIAKAVENVSTGAQDQAADTQHVAESVKVMGDEIQTITSNTGSLAETANRMNQAKDKVVETLEVLTTTNNSTMRDVKDVNEQITLTNKSIDAIYEALNLIQDIASQTNLLSLNASIEAARAGEVGKGFAVVAEEIKKLAEQSSETSERINENLNSLVSNYQLIVQKMDSTTGNINNQNAKLTETKSNFVTLENGINETNSQITVISRMVDELDKERAKINDAVMNLSAVSQENAASTEEIMASIEELNSIVALVDNKASGLTELSSDLAGKVSVFTI